MGKLIVITGLDGSGTSTIANHLHELDPGSLLIKNPVEPFLHCRDQIDCLVRDLSPSSHFFYYLASNIYASRIIDKHISDTGCNVYSVRYFIDTVVSHRALGIPVQFNYKTEVYEIRKPDLTFFLTIDEAVRQERLRDREKSYLDRALDDSNFRQKLLYEFSKLSEHFIQIDNSNKAVDDLLGEIREYINQ
jgi:thymidylate kinase